MGESPEVYQGAPRPRTSKEYEDPHFHDEDEAGGAPSGEEAHRPAGAGPPRPNRKLPPRARRFQED